MSESRASCAPERGHGCGQGAMSWQTARLVAGAAAPTPPTVEVPLASAYGCRLAEPLRALVPLPGVDVSAMDGYAVAGAPPWRVMGRVLAGGKPFTDTLKPGEAVEIATGAPVPEGATAVLPYESSRRDAEFVRGEVVEGKHVRRRGEDVAEGAVVLAAGTPVTPVVLGFAAGLGHDTLPVRPRPRVDVLVTGDEVLTAGLPEPGRVRDAIGPWLSGLVAWAGGEPRTPVRIPDGADPLRAALSDGGGADVVVVCGASSKGPADHLRAVLGGLRAEVLVDGVAVRPGHPQLLARLPDGRMVVGLPGNPFAALAAALTLLVPLLRTSHEPGPRAELAGKVKPHPANTRLVAVRVEGRTAIPVGHDRPGSLWGAALADALAVVPPAWAGEPVELLELPR
ncbi:molybdopterin molybdotransferase MoeA [Nonomuraea sp. NPDC046570]|uniref:molybdopterin molybdotransferase MoeA n=1 Tax=Nonomuraea sp. NPDC046570 TaxID=3155255 RepID=UPI0033C24BA8